METYPVSNLCCEECSDYRLGFFCESIVGLFILKFTLFKFVIIVV
jgi:hypothetical protein